MNRIITLSGKQIRKIASASFKGKMLEAVLFALMCQLLVQVPTIIFGFLPVSLQSNFLANVINIYSLVVNGPATLGLCHYFALVARGEANQGFAEIKFGFNNIYKALFLYIRIRLITWLFSLFFVIPGIIASINYSQSFFILNENPNRSAAECMIESKFVMNGNKIKYLTVLVGYLPIYILASAPAGVAHLILDSEAISQIQTFLIQGDMENAMLAANVVHPIVPVLLLCSAVSSAFISTAQITFFDMLAGKIVIRSDNEEYEVVDLDETDSKAAENKKISDEFSMITFDSRAVKPGALFFCKGQGFKKEYLKDAIANGAKAYVSEVDYGVNIPFIKANNIRTAMADIANDYYSNAWESYPTIGLTGSKGKSTTLYFLKSIFEAANKNVGYLSTIDTYDGIEQFESHLTTPEALELHHHFDNARKANLDAFMMEVSSQGLKYDRTRGVIFTIGAFLNFGSDHIGEGEHEDVEDYFKSKLKLMAQCKTAVINKKSDRFEEIYKAAEDSAICEKIILYSEDDYKEEYKLAIPGSFNKENAVCAIAIAKELGIDDEAIKTGLATAKVPGRMEVFENPEKEVVCIVDYAHSILSFDKLFSSVKEMYEGYRIEALFGCPGGKGLQRRVDLPNTVSKYADFVWVTEEDPGLEDPKEICEILKQNLDKLGTANEVIVNRDEAIKTAISSAKPKTVIVLTGKGREEYMHRGNDYVPFTPETTQVERYLNEL